MSVLDASAASILISAVHVSPLPLASLLFFAVASGAAVHFRHLSPPPFGCHVELAVGLLLFLYMTFPDILPTDASVILESRK